MRCGTARKQLSDALDGALPSGRRPRLEAHLRSCAVCRSYRDGLDRIQAEARLPEDRPPEFWASFEKDLDAKLETARASGASAAVPFPARRRLAWAAGALLVLAGIALWSVLRRPPEGAIEAWTDYEDVLDPILQAAEANPELASRVDREILATLDETTPSSDASAALVPAADPLFWEGLSEEDLRDIVAGLENETGLGGPQ
jgi:hypothetical protein